MEEKSSAGELLVGSLRVAEATEWRRNNRTAW